MKTWLAMAREKSELSPEDCASALGCSKNTYMSREKCPGNMSVDELRALRSVLNQDGRRILWNALRALKP